MLFKRWHSAGKPGHPRRRNPADWRRKEPRTQTWTMGMWWNIKICRCKPINAARTWLRFLQQNSRPISRTVPQTSPQNMLFSARWLRICNLAEIDFRWFTSWKHPWSHQPLPPLKEKMLRFHSTHMYPCRLTLDMVPGSFFFAEVRRFVLLVFGPCN